MWDMYSDVCLPDITEQFLIHIIRLLNVFSHVIDETTPVIPQSKPVLQNIPAASSLSPIKRRSKSDASDLKIKSVPIVKHTPDKEDKSERDRRERDSKSNAMGYFASSTHYMKLYEILRMAYTNYKVQKRS